MRGTHPVFHNITLSFRDYPRACGEHAATSNGTPRRRGITPAHAGNTVSVSGRSGDLQDHPRACGEHSSCHPAKSPVKLGSPPRMRGTRSPCRAAVATCRITPAHAGNTSGSGAPRTSSPQDHPRACGEHFSCTWHSKPVLMHGITPAHAGNTRPDQGRPHHLQGSPPRMRGTPVPHCGTSMRHFEDHPRACGEHTGYCQLTATAHVKGSPPRMRGTQGQKLPIPVIAA